MVARINKVVKSRHDAYIGDVMTCHLMIIISLTKNKVHLQATTC